MVVSHCVVNFQHHTTDTSLDCYVYRTGSFVVLRYILTNRAMDAYFLL